VRNIPRIQHDEAMAITAEENRRLWELLVEIRPDQWSLPTDCTRWDVRAIVIHLIASAEAQASAVEFVRQAVVGSRLTKQIGGIYPVDGLNEAGLRARSHLTPAELPELWSSVAARALRARRRMPRPIRALPLLRLAPKYWKPLGYLYDIGFTRDVWMHRVDLSRAIGRTFDATASHDGRIVADIIAEWATTHQDPFTLKLTVTRRRDLQPRPSPHGRTHRHGRHRLLPHPLRPWNPRRRPPPPTPPLEHSAPRSPMAVR
jgi:uncharacterized protein (TIGR03083 family)